MNAVRSFLVGLVERRRVDRRTPAFSTTPEQAMQFIRETRYTGWYITHCAEGVPKRIDFPNPEGIDLTR